MFNMTQTIEKINQMEFVVTNDEQLLVSLDATYTLVSIDLPEAGKVLLRQDLDFFVKKGRWLVHNTFAGGIIFLREPETITKIEIAFHSDPNAATATVEYASEKRNPRNVKYKPNAGKVESTAWPMAALFPNFNKHPKDIQIVLMAIIGKIVQNICESYRTNSWFMKFELPFEIELFLDNESELNYKVELNT